MTKKSKKNMKIISIILMITGAGLAFWAYQMSGAISSQFSQALTGSASDDVIVRYIAGAGCFISGWFLFIKK